MKVVAMCNFGWPLNKKGYEKLAAEYVEIPAQTESEIIEATSDADAVLAPIEPHPRKVIEHMRKCRIISVAGIGYDYVDVDAATEYGICVSNVPGYCVEEVSDHAMALLICCARKIQAQVNWVREGKWDTMMSTKILANVKPIFRLQGETLGIVGFGNIGRALVPKARGFGIKVIAYDPYIALSVAKETEVELVEFDEVLARADFISLHMPLANENRHMFGLEQFKKMKPSAILINTARGELVDESALYTAVTKGYIAGAGLDVTEREPLAPDNPLLKLDNVLITPHSAFYSEQSHIEVLRRAEEEVFRVLSGKWPQNFVNPQVKENYIRRHKKVLKQSR